MNQLQEHAAQIELNRDRSLEALQRQMLRLGSLAGSLASPRAREFLSHGIGRRLGLISRSIANVFETFPCAREELLSREELSDIAINYHAFLININGILDNAALVVAHERKLSELLKRRQHLGLFRDETQAHLPEAVRTYLQGTVLQEWHRTYAKNYRDALAHRVPPYVAPSQIRPQDAPRVQELEAAVWNLTMTGRLEEARAAEAESRSLQSITPFLMHSFTEEEGAAPVLLHAQLLADANTVNEICERVFPAALHAV